MDHAEPQSTRRNLLRPNDCEYLQVRLFPPTQLLSNLWCDQNRLNGLYGYYSGFLPHLARTVPNATVTLFFIEKLTQLAQAYYNNSDKPT